jgi:hypothetical protein
VRETFPHFRKRQRPEFMAWMRSAGRWQLDLDGRFLAPLDDPGDARRRLGPSFVRHVALVFSTGSCRLCPVVAFLDRRGYGARARARLQRLFHRAVIAEGADVEPPVSASGVTPARSRSRLSRLTGRIVEAALRPCRRHHLVRNLLTTPGTDWPGGLSDVSLGPAGLAGFAEPGPDHSRTATVRPQSRPHRAGPRSASTP